MIIKKFNTRIVIIILVGVALVYTCTFGPDVRAEPYDQFKRIANALEAYAVDHNGQYPRTDSAVLPPSLTTPVAYITAAEIVDPPTRNHGPMPYLYRNLTESFAPGAPERLTYGAWIVASQRYERTTLSPAFPGSTGVLRSPIPYDPTNGLLSWGDLYRAQLLPNETGR